MNCRHFNCYLHTYPIILHFITHRPLRILVELGSVILNLCFQMLCVWFLHVPFPWISFMKHWFEQRKISEFTIDSWGLECYGISQWIHTLIVDIGLGTQGLACTGGKNWTMSVWIKTKQSVAGFIPPYHQETLAYIWVLLPMLEQIFQN